MMADVGTRYAVNATRFRLYLPGATGFRQIPRRFRSGTSNRSTAAWIVWSKSGLSVTGTVDREQEGDGAAEEGRLLAVVDLADVFDTGLIEQGLDLGREIVAIDRVDLRRDLERQTAAPRDPDRAVDRLFGCDAAEKSEIAGLHRLRCQQALGEPMIDGSDPVALRHWTPLRIGDRDRGGRRESTEYR